MINIEELIAKIEGQELINDTGIASSLKVFLRIIGANQAVRDLCKCADQADVSTAILERIFKLVPEASDSDFEHPWDTTLAVYLWILKERAPLAAGSAGTAVRTGKNLHWAHMIAATSVGQVGVNGQEQTSDRSLSLS